MPQRTSSPGCNRVDHLLNRRSFFGVSAGGLAGGLVGLNGLALSAVTDALQKKQKRVLMLFLSGGASQFETFDPKPGRPTGGPFLAIPTSVPGYHISELMPEMSKRIHKYTAVIRSIETKNGDHVDVPLYGGKPTKGVIRYPSLGCMLASELGRPDSSLPHHVSFSNYLGQNYAESAGFLGARWNPINVFPNKIAAQAPFTIDDSELNLSPPGTQRPPFLTQEAHQRRNQLRTLFSQKFVQTQIVSETVNSYESAYARVPGLMANANLFSLDGEPAHIVDRYGPTPFGKQAIVARRLIEAGVPFVRVTRGWWDHHGQNFEFHQEMVPELDWVMSALLDDLHDRGLLEHTLVMTFSEMGRTPHVNNSQGRDHFPRMSVTLSGCGIKPGVIYGQTDKDGQEIADGEVNLQQFFATVFQAVGIDHQKENIASDGRPVPLTDYSIEPIQEVLA
ncbi:MAG: DUF1501 domain-containing protein [Planctomycetota bacterium]|nr:DUF1501 domain-containing protein [Planctomycetota bacterium]MDA1178868.1 DUF1501 domain-containing protein [Planctomycetota bacterium]